MTRIVQICPVGFEFHRILEGVRIHPSNVLYLLRSFKKEVKRGDPDAKLIEIANNYVEKLYEHFKQSDTFTEVHVRDTRIISYMEAIRELCEIIKIELDMGDVETIYINTSTSNKLFVSVAMYVGSFFPGIIKLFYLRSSRYTINHLLDDDLDKEEIKNIFTELGMTYKKEGETYHNIDIPVYPIQILSNENQVILKTLNELIGEKDDWVTFMSLLSKMGEEEKDKTTKMRYSHHIKKLKQQILLEEKVHGRQKSYKLTEAGKILGLIYSYFHLDRLHISR